MTNFYPIFKRELARTARRNVVFRLRLGTVLFAVTIGILLLKGAGTWQAGSAVGREIFEWVTWPAFVLCLLSGVLLSSNLLCEERREGSLALLFLTRVKGVDVILGKLGAVGLLTCQIVFAVVPVTALCLVLGGVSGAEFSRVIQVLLTTLFASLSIGILVSALNRSMGRSALISFFAIVGTTLGLAALDWRARQEILPLASGIIVPGPIQLFLAVPDVQFRLVPENFRASLLGSIFVSLGLLLLAGSMLKRLSITSETARSGKQTVWNYQSGWRLRRRGLHRNPIHWLVLRDRRRWFGTWLLFAILVALWVLFLGLFSDKDWAEPIGFFLLGPLVHFLFKVVVLSETSEFFSLAKRGELELLLVSPLSTSKIILGHSRALLRHFAWPAAMLFATDLFLVFFHRSDFGFPSEQRTAGYLFTFGLGITLLIDLPALIWRGLWNGLRSRSTVSAMRRTFIEVIVLPLPFFAGAMAAAIWANMVFSGLFLEPFGGRLDLDGGVQTIGVVVFWWLTSMITGLLLQRDGQQNLTQWFRFLAANAGAGARLGRRKSVILPGPRFAHLRPAEISVA